jgi:hypothetical protein
LARQFGDTFALSLLSSMGLSSQLPAGLNAGLGLKWEGRRDSVLIAHSAVRAYRLETLLLDRYRIAIFVSRVGEILRVELPDEVVLVNDQLANL